MIKLRYHECRKQTKIDYVIKYCATALVASPPFNQLNLNMCVSRYYILDSYTASIKKRKTYSEVVFFLRVCACTVHLFPCSVSTGRIVKTH